MCRSCRALGGGCVGAASGGGCAGVAVPQGVGV